MVPIEVYYRCMEDFYKVLMRAPGLSVAERIKRISDEAAKYNPINIQEPKDNE